MSENKKRFDGLRLLSPVSDTYQARRTNLGL
jgi:hypothetical protein